MFNRGPGADSFLPIPLLLAFALLIAAVSSVAAYHSWTYLSIQNDGVQYLSTAKNIVNGDGIATDTLAFGPHFQDKIPGPQTMWPPGYPSLIALVASFTGDFERAALSINLTAHFIGALLLGLLLLRCGLPASWALMGAGLFYLTFFQWTFIAGLLSEPVFSAAILASLCLLPNVKTSGYGRYLACGILLAVVLLVRHSAVIYIAGAGLGVFGLLCIQLMRKAETVKGLLLKCVLLGSPGVLLFAALMLRVRLTTSSAITVHGTHAPEDLYFFLSTVFSELGWFLGFYTYGEGIPTLIGKLMTVVFIALILIWIMLSMVRSWSARKLHANPDVSLDGSISQPQRFRQQRFRDFRTVLYTVVVVHTLLFFLYFGYCMMTEIPLKFSRRYFFQIHSGLLIMFLALLFSGSRQAKQGNSGNRLGLTLGLSVFLLFTVAQVHSLTGVSLKQERNSEIQRMLDFPLNGLSGSDGMIGAVNESNNTLRKLVDACFDISSADPVNINRVQRQQGVIWSGQGQMLHQHLRVPTIALANRYREAAMDFNAFSQDIETYNIRMLIMMPLWALENAWKIPGIVEWAKAENMPVVEIVGYHAYQPSSTLVVFVDPQCAP